MIPIDKIQIRRCPLIQISQFFSTVGHDISHARTSDFIQLLPTTQQCCVYVLKQPPIPSATTPWVLRLPLVILLCRLIRHIERMLMHTHPEDILRRLHVREYKVHNVVIRVTRLNTKVLLVIENVRDFRPLVKLRAVGPADNNSFECDTQDGFQPMFILHEKRLLSVAIQLLCC
ncbi:uncharacterized protein LOC113468630 [Diaphorina citri]|uniref:Uncharacterized protein LOC113468630 n=1 Tax=Diaphorina citri TaxID=121845 RepID=A0A3Q0IZ83_DIACI|nr:uncharacterized protein LOC113468630 [Diaphorina citri]